MRSRVLLATLGLLSLILYFGVTEISKQFNWGESHADRPIPTYAILYLALFVLYALAAWRVSSARADRGALWIILLFGLLFRAALMPSHQIQEDDVYRYLWDGKVFARGINPYEYAPDEINNFKMLQIEEPDEFNRRYNERNVRELSLLYQLKWENESAFTTLERVNHSSVPTIYPPLAQHVFRLVSQIKPDSIIAMRLAFLAFDLCALGFIILILGALGKDRNLCLIYFWSPLLIKETFNSTHLDIIGIAALCASVYFLIRSRHTLAVFCLSLGVLGKLYPVILFPLYLKAMLQKSRDAGPHLASRLAPWANTLLFLGVILIVYLPFLGAPEKTFAGLKAYATYWQKNDSIFSLLVYFYDDLLGLNTVGDFSIEDLEVYFSYDMATLLSKITVALALAAVVLFFSFKRGGAVSPSVRVNQIFIILALVFLLSPVQNPWYLTWVLPFLCVFPWRSWILLTGLIGLYYMDFYFIYQDQPQYKSWLPWIEYAPFYLLLALEFWRKRRPPKNETTPV